jgi:hypothetical protein
MSTWRLIPAILINNDFLQKEKPTLLPKAKSDRDKKISM